MLHVNKTIPKDETTYANAPLAEIVKVPKYLCLIKM